MPTRREVDYEFWEERRPLFSSDKAFQTAFNKTREALALLAAVAHVDQEGWKYLLKTHCNIFDGPDGAEMFEEDLPAQFMLYFTEDSQPGDDQEYVETLKTDLVQLCGVYQREHPSRAYLKTLNQMSSFDKNLKAGKPGVDLDVAVQVGFRVMDFDSYGILSETLEPFQDIRAAEKIIQEEWEEYEQSPKKKDVRCGNLRCTVRLGPMIADFHDMKFSTEVVKEMETMIQENARFSQVNLQTFIDPELKKKEQKVVYSRMMATIFNTTRRELAHVLKSGDSGVVQVYPTTEPLQLGTVHVGCSSLLSPREVEALCSGMVVSQTTTKLSMFLGIYPHYE
ncbi:hypothetical protein V7S43_010723 [Phytophthora oleae]|uniref:Uncharacterized protein n=1 Tax=Phytophthora oleae TaxID=2107226 RepID=A0ABD3FER5_9STRA